MKTLNEKKRSKGSGGKTGLQKERSQMSNQTSQEASFKDVGKNKFLTALGIIAGGALVYKAAKALTGSGKTAINKKAILEIKSTLVINRPKEELYSYWRNLENLPNFMSHIQEVNELDNKRSHWVAEVPGGLGHIEWEAEIVWEQENQLLAWRSLPDSEIENSGEVRFLDSGNRKSTIVETTISYRPQLGKAGEMAVKLLNPAFKKVVENDLKEFKKLMERGSVSKRKGSPARRV
jgi:uncharacterized membrane protein